MNQVKTTKTAVSQYRVVEIDSGLILFICESTEAKQAMQEIKVWEKSSGFIVANSRNYDEATAQIQSLTLIG